MAALTVLMGMALLGLSGWFIAATAIAGWCQPRRWCLMCSCLRRAFACWPWAHGFALRRAGGDARNHLGRTGCAARKTVYRLGTARRSPFAAAAPSTLATALDRRCGCARQPVSALVVPVVAAAGAALLAGVVLGALQWLAGFGCAGCGCYWQAWTCTLWLIRRSTRPAISAPWRWSACARRPWTCGWPNRFADGRAAGRAMRAPLRNPMPAWHRPTTRSTVWMRKPQHGFATAGALTLWWACWQARGIWWMPVSSVHPGAALALLVALTAMEPFNALRRGALEAGRTRLSRTPLGTRHGQWACGCGAACRRQVMPLLCWTTQRYSMLIAQSLPCSLWICIFKSTARSACRS